MAKLHRVIRQPVETAAFRAGLALIPLMPRRALLGLAWLGGTLGFLFDGRGKAVGRANLDLAFGDTKTPAEKSAILRAAYITMSRTFLDVIWFGKDPARRLPRYVEMDASMNQLFCHKNQICITAHFGNWEAVGQIMALQGFPFHSIAMPVKNPAVDRLFIERREITGQKIIPRDGALRKLLGVLRGNGKTAFLVDQNTPPNEGGIWADYFGLPVCVTPAPAALAAKTGSEIFIGFCAPQPGGRYRVYITETIAPPQTPGEEATQTLTQQILFAIEREVSRHPEHWLWMYKRWKAVKPDSDPARYPWYSRRRRDTASETPAKTPVGPLPAFFRKLLPALVMLFLLSFTWSKNWRLVSYSYYSLLFAAVFAWRTDCRPPLKRLWPLAALLGWLFLATLWSPELHSADLIRSAKHAICILALPLIFCIPGSTGILWQWLPPLASLPIALSTVLFYQRNPLCARLEQFGEHFNSSGWTFAFFIVMALSNLQLFRKKSALTANLAALTVLIPALLLTQSRGAILGLTGGGAILLGIWLLRRLRVRPHQIVLLILICAITAPRLPAAGENCTPPENITEAATEFFSRGTTYRVNIWTSVLDQMPNHWLIGHGLNADYLWLETNFSDYGIPYPIYHLHSLLFWTLFHSGLIGLGLTLILIGQALRLAARHGQRTGEWLPLALLTCGLLCTCVDGANYFYRPRPEWIIFWVPVSLALTCSLQPPRKSPASLPQ